MNKPDSLELFITELINEINYPASSLARNLAENFFDVIKIDINKILSDYETETKRVRCNNSSCPVCYGVAIKMYESRVAILRRIRDILEPHKSEFAALFEQAAEIDRVVKRTKFESHQQHRN